MAGVGCQPDSGRARARTASLHVVQPQSDRTPGVGESTPDAAIARSLAAGDPAALERVYRRYAERIYTYCRSVLHDADGAADATHDTFIVASQRAGQLRDPSRLRPWLYAIARNECLRILRVRRRQAPLEAAPEMSDETVDMVAGLRADQLRELVQAATASLSDGDRDVIELALRHDLAAADVGAVLGVSVNHVHARLSRARGQLESALGALLVARTGAQQCEELNALLTGWDGQLTVLLRKRLSRHIKSCEVCGELQRRQLQPSTLLAGYAALPFLMVPDLLHRMRLCSSDDRSQIAKRAGRFDGEGFPAPADRRTGGLALRVASVAALILLVIGTAAFFEGRSVVGEAVWQSPAGTPPPSGPSPLTSPTPDASPSTSPSASTTPSASSSPPASLSPSPGRPPPSPLTVRADGKPSCVDRGWIFNAYAYVTGGTAEKVVLHWRAGTGSESTAAMAWNGQSWQGSTGTLGTDQTIDWWITADAADGGSGESAPQQANGSSCVPG